ncbi:MAG: hypothetical protein JWN72_741 [Thermoleophilia bacterium]|nr:hypothetical protein [Thermoleophilia bacterium]
MTALLIADAAYQAGYVVGIFVGPLLVAAIIRGIYVAIRRSGRRVFDKWFWIIAAIVFVLSAAGRAAGNG